ncbi:MAG: 3-hydroxyisobutyrate dehydrogenase [Rhodospirillaceae bacterium]|nr:3-hydroxyisobutyrate dehydrogenase [Rhodospirillaceae bacterium]
MSLSGTKMAWIGAGKMGGPMSRRLVGAGAELSVFDPVPANVDAVVAAGARAAISNQAAVGGAEIVVSMIPNDAVLRAITIGDDGIFSSLAPGAIYVDMSTVSPEISGEVAAAASDAGIAYLRAPVSGSTTLAEAGKLTIMVSGDKDAADRCADMFAAMGAQQFYLGAYDQARYLKLVINLLVGTTGAVLSEALSLGRKGGLDWEQMLDVIGVSAVASPYIQYNLEPLKARDFSPLFTTEQMVKDSRLICDAGGNADVPMAIGHAMLKIFEDTIEAGYGEENLTAAIKVLERRSGLDEL